MPAKRATRVCAAGQPATSPTLVQVDGEQVSLVVPCADMANHLPTPNASYRFSTEVCEAGIMQCGHASTRLLEACFVGLQTLPPGCPQARMFQLLAVEPITCGAETCISYHHGKSNEELFRDSGFIIPGNPLDRIKFGSKATSAVQFGMLLRAASSGTMSGSSNAGGSSGPASSGGEPERGLDLRRLMRALQIPSRVRDGTLELPAVPATPDQGRKTALLLSLQDHLRTGLSPAASSSGSSSGNGAAAGAELQQERRCAAGLLEEARQMLAGHGTSAATDELLLAGADGALSPRRQQAIASRLERKRLLQTAIDVFEAYTANLE